MRLQEILRLEQPWLESGIDPQTAPSKRIACPVHGSRSTLQVKRYEKDGRHTIYARCHSPQCNFNQGGTILDLKVAIGEYQDTRQAAINLLMKYGELKRQEAESEVEKSFFNARISQTTQGLTAPKPCPQPKLTPPTHYYDAKQRRLSDISEIIQVGSSDTVINLALDEVTSYWMASAKYGSSIRTICVMRWDYEHPVTQDKLKTIRPFTHTGTGGWASGIPSIKVRPLYKMYEISEAPPEAGIIIVEGEKCMDSMEQLIVMNEFEIQKFNTGRPWIVTSCIGGAQGASNTDFSCIGNRPVIIIPDCDEAGLEYARTISQAMPLKDIEVIWVQPEKSEGDGYDVADFAQEGGSLAELFSLHREAFGQRALIRQLRDRASAVTVDGVEGLIADIAINISEANSIVIDNLLYIIKKETNISSRVLRDRLAFHLSDGDMRPWFVRISEEAIDYVKTGIQDDIWWHYDGRVWYPDRHGFTVQAQIIEHMLESYKGDNESFFKVYKQAVESAAQFATAIHPIEEIYSDEKVFNCRNKEILIENNALNERGHHPSHKLRSLIDIDHDPEATCPKYDKMLIEIFEGDEQLIKLWHQICGYVLQPSRELAHFFVLQGTGSNGKSTLIKVLGQLLGRAAAFNTIKSIDERFGTWQLLDKLLFVDDDVEANTLLPDGVVKKLSEGKRSTIEVKNKGFLNLTITTALMMLCNNPIKTRDLSPGARRRLVVIPFNRAFSDAEKDPSLLSYIIHNEMPGVLNRCIEGARQLFEQGRLVLPDKVILANNKWFGDANMSAEFILKHLKKSETSSCSMKDIYPVYERWVIEEGGARTVRIGQKQLAQAIEYMGYSVSPTSAKYGRYRINNCELISDSL